MACLTSPSAGDERIEQAVLSVAISSFGEKPLKRLALSGSSSGDQVSEVVTSVVNETRDHGTTGVVIVLRVGGAAGGVREGGRSGGHERLSQRVLAAVQQRLPATQIRGPAQKERGTVLTVGVGLRAQPGLIGAEDRPGRGNAAHSAAVSLRPNADE